MNATYLFQKPFCEFHSSESYWSAFFALFLLNETRAPVPRRLPIWRYTEPDKYRLSDELDLRDITLDGLVVEGSLCGRPFNLPSWPMEYNSLKVDVVLIRGRRLTLIETKTIGASIARNLLLYLAVAEHLRTQGWQAEVYHLISYGHETENDWKLISQHQLQLLFWEDVFRLASSTPLGHMLGVDLNEYADLPRASERAT